MKATLESIYAACDEVGTCRVWRLGVNGVGLPVMRPSGSGQCASVRRIVYRELHPDRPLSSGLYVTPRCLNKRCLGEHCLRATPRGEYMKALAVLGVYKSPAAEKKISTKARARTGRTIEDARAIRAALAMGITRTTLARKYDVSIDTISKIGNHRTWRDTDLAPNASVFAMRA